MRFSPWTFRRPVSSPPRRDPSRSARGTIARSRAGPPRRSPPRDEPLGPRDGTPRCRVAGPVARGGEGRRETSVEGERERDVERRCRPVRVVDPREIGVDGAAGRARGRLRPGRTIICARFASTSASEASSNPTSSWPIAPVVVRRFVAEREQLLLGSAEENSSGSEKKVFPKPPRLALHAPLRRCGCARSSDEALDRE